MFDPKVLEDFSNKMPSGGGCIAFGPLEGKTARSKSCSNGKAKACRLLPNATWT